MMSNIQTTLEEVKLFRLPSERERYDNMAECYSIIQTIGYLEKAYIKGAVTRQQYTAECSTLLAQYKAAFKLIETEFGTPERFLRKYKFDAGPALERIREGRPMTIDDEKDIGSYIAEIVSGFITISDSLRLSIKSMDGLLPPLQELIDKLNKFNKIKPGFEGSTRVKNWVDKMSTMSASDELDEAQVRQIIHDMDTSLTEFHKFLKSE